MEGQDVLVVHVQPPKTSGVCRYGVRRACPGRRIRGQEDGTETQTGRGVLGYSSECGRASDVRVHELLRPTPLVPYDCP